jgi:esterase/lipase
MLKHEVKKMPYRLIIFVSMIFLSFTPVYGDDIEKISLKVSDSINATANFYPGDKDKPSILILHGFMLTAQFHTVNRLAESLHESGFTVLTPTLSLGINKRAKSLECEAIHTHSLSQDLKEIDLWNRWLHEKTGKNTILIGHSSASIMLIWYLADTPSSPVDSVIFLSLPNFGPSQFNNETEADARAAQDLVEKNNHALHEFGLAYCKKYVSSAKDFLSYYQLSKANIRKKLEQLSIDKTLIYGSEDKRIDRQWNQDLEKLDIQVITIKKANHFFDFEHEFELLDTIETLLNQD